MQSQWQVLVEYQRSGISEVTKFGALAWVSGTKLIHSYGSALCFGRSTAKPFHMKVFCSELADKLSWEQKALSVGSHNGEPKQLRRIHSILPRTQARFMQTPESMPLHIDSNYHKKVQRWYHPCSGEHSAILLGCECKGWDLETYRSYTHHPFHASYLRYVQSVLGDHWQPRVTATDGCGLATDTFEIKELAQLYSHLVREKNKDWIWEAMVRCPDYVGGKKRLDTTILKSCDGHVIAKEGADGLLGLAIEHPNYPEGLGVFIKLAHGTDNTAMWYLAHEILKALGWSLDLPSAPSRQIVQVHPEILPKALQVV